MGANNSSARLYRRVIEGMPPTPDTAIAESHECHCHKYVRDGHAERNVAIGELMRLVGDKVLLWCNKGVWAMGCPTKLSATWETGDIYDKEKSQWIISASSLDELVEVARKSGLFGDAPPDGGSKAALDEEVGRAVMDTFTAMAAAPTAT